MAKLSEEEKKRFEPNAWFVGFAPLDDPELVVAVIVQRGGSGSSAAAPIAGKIFEAYYQKRSTPPEGIELALVSQP
jgi:cell division protein FtsI/penicillin-binding protein 2